MSSSSSSSYSYTLSPESYTLPLLHAAKYASSTVLGIYIGTTSPLSSSSTPQTVTITKTIPLLHHYTSLSPIVEAGISLIQQEIKGRGKGERVVGLYVGYEGEQQGLGRVGERTLEGLKDDFDGAFGLAIHDEQLGEGSNAYTFHLGPPHSKSVTISSSGFPESFTLEKSEEVIKGALEMIRKDPSVHQSIVDFDDHVENSDLDWIANEKATKAIQKRFE